MPKRHKAAESRDCRIALFVAPSHLARISEAAANAGLSRAELLRRVLRWGWLAMQNPEALDYITRLYAARDSDGSPKGGDACGSVACDDSAGRQASPESNQP